MPSYRFHFYFPQMSEEASKYTVWTWGGHIGTAMSRAWKVIKQVSVYAGSNKLLQEMTVTSSVTKGPYFSKRNGPGFLE